MDYLQATVDKFVFRVAPDYRYSDAYVWAKRDGSRIRVGLTDYLQQRSGDVAFVNLKEVGTALTADDELAALETIKIDLVIPAPVGGRMVAVNAALAANPELINSDPYGAGCSRKSNRTIWQNMTPCPTRKPAGPGSKPVRIGAVGMTGDKRVIIIPCSGIGKAYGSVGREAMLQVVQDLRPDSTETVCLGLLTLGDASAQAKVRAQPTITIDGCPKACAQANVQAAGGRPVETFRVFDVFRAHKELKVRSASELGENGQEMARLLAKEIAAKVDALIAEEK